MATCVKDMQLVAPPATATTLVDVQLLIDRPKAALLGVLKLLEGWESASEDTITVEQFSGAMTNLVYRCGLQEGGKETQLVLMRVHASASDLFDRAAEVATFQSVSAAGLGPHLLLLFGNGRVEQFLSQQVTLVAADLREPAVSEAIAQTMAHFHSRMSEALAGDPHHQGPVQLWGRLHDWHRLALEHSSAQELQQLGMAGLEDEINQLQEALCAAHPCWVALCHNDLQYGNIMAPAGPAAAAGEDTAAAAGLAQQLGSLGLGLGSASAVEATGGEGAAGLAAAGHTVATAAALQQHQQATSSSTGTGVSAAAAGAAAAAAAGPAAAGSGGLAHGHSMESLPSEVTDFSAVALAGSSPTPSVASLPAKLHESGSASSLHLRGRSPGRSLQLPDGSLVLPGMKARPRGQSPERGKRPDSFAVLGGSGDEGCGSFSSNACAGLSGSGSSGMQAAAAAWAGGVGAVVEASASAASFGSQSELGLAGGVGGLQPPSAAAVLRHSSSAGELFVSAGLPGAAGASAAAATAAEAKGFVHRRGRISTSGLDTSESAEDSEDADAILPLPLHMPLGSPTAAESDAAARARGRGAGSSSGDGGVAAAAGSSSGAVRRPGRGSVSGLAEDIAAAAARSASYYQRLRRERRQPAEGIEFPTFRGSDGDGSGSSSDYGSSSEDDKAAAPCTIGGSSSGSLSDAEQRCDSAGGRSSGFSESKPVAAAVTRSSMGGPKPLPDGTAGSPTAADTAAVRGAAAAKAASEASLASAGGEPGHAAEGGPQNALLTLIDYEYSGLNPVAYDIANHWCEWAADYHTQEPHVLDFSRLPDEQQQRAFVEAYVQALLEGLGLSVAGVNTDASDAADADAGRAGHFASAGMRAKLGACGARGSSIGGGSSAADEEAVGDERESVEGASMWSTLSSTGGSVLSMPADADGADGAPADGAVSSVSSSQAGASSAAAAAAAAAGLEASASSELRSIWRWLDQHQPDRRLLAGSRQLDAACFERLVAALMAASRAYMACSHLLWALWGVIQSRVSDVDFDFEGYGLQRWQQYLLTRPPGLAQR